MYDNNLVLGNYFDTGLEGRNECTLSLSDTWNSYGGSGYFFLLLWYFGNSEVGVVGLLCILCSSFNFVMVIVGFVKSLHIT